MTRWTGSRSCWRTCGSETGASAHVPVLHSFHAIVELQESTRILVELANARRPQHPNPGHARTLIQDTMETWRLRTPNRWDPLPQWNEVLTWRGYMYGVIAAAAEGLVEAHPQLVHQGHQLDRCLGEEVVDLLSMPGTGFTSEQPGIGELGQP